MTSADEKIQPEPAAHEGRFAAAILTRSARAIAGEATGRLLASQPAAGAGFGRDPFSAWQNWLAARVEELSTAVGLQRPTLFVEQTQWAAAVLSARGIAPSNFRAGLECLCKVVEESLPLHVRSIAAAPILLALAKFPADASSTAVAAKSLLATDEPFGKLASEYLLAVLEGDSRRAGQMVMDSVDKGVAVRDLYLRVLCPAQTEAGRMWLHNEISIADEHLCSATTRRLMGRLVQLARVVPPNGKTVATAAVAGNRHEIGQQVVADFFEMDGWRTLELGADVPAAALVELIESNPIDLLALSATLAVQLPVLRDTIATVRASEHARSLMILVGGRTLIHSAELAAELGADAFAADAEQAVEVGRRLVGL